jgi:superfamily I DNA/RNA helicase/RecB family exonuclease
VSNRRWKLVRAADRTSTWPTPDPVQQRVIAHTNGPLLVRGEAGAGKTTTLVEAVAARVAEGVDPQRILVLTFSRRGAQQLRSRIEGRISRAAATAEPLVRTFPAYAFGLLRRAATLEGEPPPRLLSGAEQDLVIRELLPGFSAKWPDYLQPALGTRAFAEQLRDLLLRAAERGVPADDPLWTRRDDWAAAARFMREYEQTMALRDATTRSSAGYDHAELVRSARALLEEDPALLEQELSRIEFIYVDELADTDPAQIELLQVIAGGARALVAFGDADSSTFAFRGADPTIMRTFPDAFAGAQTVELPEVHRGRPAVEAYALRTRGSEAAYVAQRLRQAHLTDGVPWSRMAVIMRSTNLQLSTYERALRHAGVPTVVHAEDLPLHQQPAVKPFLLLLRCALEPELLNEENAVALLHSPFGGADPLAERKLRQGLRALDSSAGHDPQHSGELLVAALNDPRELVALERRWAEPALRIARLIHVVRETAGRSAEEVLWAVWRDSGLADRWAAAATRPATGNDQLRRAEAADRDLDAVMVLFDAAARFTDRLPGARIQTFVEHVVGQQIPADSIAGAGDRGEAVRLLTAHAAKGLEWEIVAVCGVQEGVWPDLRLRGSLLGSEQLVDEVAQRATPNATAQRVAQTTELLREERRLFHVATTRARQRLLVTAVDSSAVGGADGDDRPSRFLHEILARSHAVGAPKALGEPPEPELVRPQRPMTLPGLVAELRVAAVEGDADAAVELARLAKAGVPGAHPDDWWGLPELSDDRPLRDPSADLETVRVTPSTMESALRCGLRWLLEKHGGSLPATGAQGVGNLVHAAAMLAEEAAAHPQALLEYVDARFDAIELAARWLSGREKERAEGMVDKLIRWLAENPRRLVAVEREFSVRLEGEPPIELTGRVDRLEVDDDGRLVVIDLKTGRTTSASAADLPEHPQLGAYQVAVEEGAFPEGDVSGGAALVQLGTTHKDAKEQPQEALRDSEDPGWAHAMVHRTADTMAASTFVAKANDSCRVCPVRTSCPVSGKGRQVVEP